MQYGNTMMSSIEICLECTSPNGAHVVDAVDRTWAIECNKAVHEAPPELDNHACLHGKTTTNSHDSKSTWIPLTVFKASHTLELPEENLKKTSPYAQSQLEGPWTTAKPPVSLKFNNLSALRAFRAALLWASDTEFSKTQYQWERGTELFVLSAAYLFQLPTLQRCARDATIRHLEAANVVSVFDLAQRCGDQLLKQAVLTWIFRSRVLAGPRPAPIPSRAVADALLLGKRAPEHAVFVGAHNPVDARKLRLDFDTGDLMDCKQRTISALQLERLYSDRIKKKAVYFRNCSASTCTQYSNATCNDLITSNDENTVQNQAGFKHGFQTKGDNGTCKPEQDTTRGLVGLRNNVEKGFAGMRKCRMKRIAVHDVEHPNLVNRWEYILRDESRNEEIILAACNDAGTCEFRFSCSYPSLFKRHDMDYVGALSSSFAGTKFTVYDFGCNKSEVRPSLFPKLFHREHGTIRYKQNILGRVPNAMTVYIPSSFNSGSIKQPGSLQERWQSCNNVKVLKTRKPKWNEYLESWTMDFKGRARLPSKRNFQLIDRNGIGEEVVLMTFGKIAQDQYCLDFQDPLSPMQAFAIALSSFADKLMVT